MPSFAQVLLTRHWSVLKLQLQPSTERIAQWMQISLCLTHILGWLAIVRLSHNVYWWALLPLLLLIPVSILIRTRQTYAWLETLAPLFATYGVIGIRLGLAVVYRLQGQEFVLEPPLFNILNINTWALIGLIWTLAGQMGLASHFFLARPLDFQRTVKFFSGILLMGTLMWAVGTYFTIRAHGVTASDPYAYTQMGYDFATTGSLEHEFPLVEMTNDLHLYTGALVPIGYRIPDTETYKSATVWSPGYGAFLAGANILFSETGFYLLTPVFGLLALVALAWLVYLLLPDLESTLLIYDDEGGYRVFLGADAVSAYELRQQVDDRQILDESAVQSTDMGALDETLHIALSTREGEIPRWDGSGEPIAAFESEFKSFYPQMLDWACDVVVDLVQNQGVDPNEIVMLAPFLNDSLRFTVMNNLRDAEIPVVSHRPSRAMREEASARAMLTLMQLVNPLEKKFPTPDDILDMLVSIVGGLDPIRAALLTQIVYGVGRNDLGSFDNINPVMQERITFSIGERYEYLRQWLSQERERVANTPPDYFLRRLFGDVVSQKGFGFHTNLDAGNIIAQLIDSAFNFRQVLYPQGVEDWSPVWMQFRQLVTEGLLAAVHDLSWRKDENQAVFIAPAFTFLLRNRPVKYQIWLDVGSYAWWERLDQPLTHPYVTQRTYPEARPWTDEDEITTQWEMLRKLVLGLTRRCEEKIYLAIADLGEQGFEQRGPLLRVFQQIMQTYGDVD